MGLGSKLLKMMQKQWYVIAIVIVIIVVLLLAYYLYRKNKNKDPDTSVKTEGMIAKNALLADVPDKKVTFA